MNEAFTIHKKVEGILEDGTEITQFAVIAHVSPEESEEVGYYRVNGHHHSDEYLRDKFRQLLH